MTRLTHIRPQFVESIPKLLDDGVLYVSEAYGTASHKCACGCGLRVVTPLTPTDWKLVREKGGVVSLYPSIGNWDYPCQSHYWIRRNHILWAARWSRDQVERGRALDREMKAAYFQSGMKKGKWFAGIAGWIRKLFN